MRKVKPVPLLRAARFSGGDWHHLPRSGPEGAWHTWCPSPSPLQTDRYEFLTPHPYTTGLASHEICLRKLLALTPLAALQWLNLNHATIQFVTLTRCIDQARELRAREFVVTGPEYGYT